MAAEQKNAKLLVDAAENGNLDVVRFLVEHGQDVNDGYIFAPLTQAACEGHLDVVQFLLEHGANVNGRICDRHTPLTKAAYGGHLDVVRFLVEHGADVNASNCYGNTPLMKAAGKGHLDVVRFLVEYGADSNLKTTTGDTALSNASEFGRLDVVQFLLPLVQHQEQRTQMEYTDEYVTPYSNIPSSWLIAPFEVEVGPFINDGHIGGDYRGKWLDADVVVKLFINDTATATFVNEVHLWCQLRHPNVLKLYGVCNSHHHFFVCEYASSGSLPEYLNSCDAEHRTPWKFLYEAALGLEYLHERKIVHGNLRGSNVLIGSDELAKLSGFALNTSSERKYNPNGWYPSGELNRWASPERLKGKKCSFASDVYSLSMCIIEALSGNVPFSKKGERRVGLDKTSSSDFYHLLKEQLSILTDKQEELVQAMCAFNPCKRLQMPTVVKKLEYFAEMEAAMLTQHMIQLKPEPLVDFGVFDSGKTSLLWIEVQALINKSENKLYYQIWHELELIHDALKAKSHSWSAFQRFHDLLSECGLALDSLSHDSQVRRLSATRARDHSIQGLYRRSIQLLQLVHPQNHNTETREAEWKRLCREQIEVFVSETSEACVLLSSVDSEEDRSALVTVLRTELQNINRKYTDKQIKVLRKTHDEIISKSLEESQFATTPEWFIPWFELEMNEMTTLGEGGYGSVIKAKWLDSEVVVKKLEIDPKDAANDDKKYEMRQMFKREVDIWFGLSHPHVVRLFGACHVGRPFFVCELAPNGTLVEYLNKYPDELWSKLREAALGVQYLHAREIVHGDLKANNILIGSDRKAKVTDFGLSGVFGDDSTNVILSKAMHWVAPECILDQKPTFASDIYSLGMCIVEALRVTNGDKFYLPWGNLPNAAVKFHVTQRHLLPSRPGNCSDEAWMLIKRMCKSVPADRIQVMTVVDELEKLAYQHEVEHDDVQLSSSSAADTLARMKTLLANCDTKAGDEGSVLKKIYKLLWDRLEHVSTQLNEITSNFNKVVQDSEVRTHDILSITGGIPLIKFTELALGVYALHRRLDKFCDCSCSRVRFKPSSRLDISVQQVYGREHKSKTDLISAMDKAAAS